MSSTATNLKLAAPVEAHLNNTINRLNHSVLEISDINKFMYELAGFFYGYSKLNPKNI